MFHSKPFKKDLTPFAKGGKVVKHIGKGAKEQSNTSFGSMTGGDTLARMANNYPKPVQAESAQPAAPVPMGTRPPGAASAMMPSDMDGDE